MAESTGRRERKPSAKIAFLEAHSEDWEVRQRETEATKGQRKRKPSKKAVEAKKAPAPVVKAAPKPAKVKASKAKPKAKAKAKSKATKAKAGKDGPKKPLSAYMYYSMATRTDVQRDFPDASFGDVAKILGERWRVLAQPERDYYDQLATADRDRYVVETANMGAEASSFMVRKAAPKKPKAPKAEATGGPTSYMSLAMEAIKTLKDRKGSSQMAIEKYITTTYPDLAFKRHHLRNALNNNWKKGVFVRIKNSFKLPPRRR